MTLPIVGWGLQSQLKNDLTDQSNGDNLSTKISFFVKWLLEKNSQVYMSSKDVG